MKAASIVVALWLVSIQAGAAGFDSSYNVYRGDFNGDARVDLYIKSSNAVVIPLDGIPLVIGPPVNDFILQYNADGTFALISGLTTGQKGSLSQWPTAGVEVSFRDADMDGHGDMELLRVSNVVAGAFDQIVLGARSRGAGPKGVTPKNAKFRNYHNDLLAALLDPNYFDSTAPYKVVSVEPPTRSYYGGIVNAGDSSTTNLLLIWCHQDYPSSQCNLTTADPSPCVRQQDVYNDRGEYLGTTTRNACNDYIHVFVYVPGSVQVERDYSVFDQDARESRDILERLRQNCSLFQPNPDWDRMNTIIGGVYGRPIGAELITDRYFPNSTAHPPAPGDELFNQNDLTFHHYDVRGKLCDLSQVNCTVSAASSDTGLRLFTHPSYQLSALLTAVDGEVLPVYVPLWPPHADTASKFVRDLGDVTQRWVQSGYWAVGIQNVTTAQHRVYPGTIVRKVFQEGNSLYVRTHGMGVNRTWCISDDPVIFSPALQGVRIAIAAANDFYGAMTFRTLDKEFAKDWRQRNGYPAPLPQTEASGPVSISRDSP